MLKESARDFEVNPLTNGSMQPNLEVHASPETTSSKNNDRNRVSRTFKQRVSSSCNLQPIVERTAEEGTSQLSNMGSSDRAKRETLDLTCVNVTNGGATKRNAHVPNLAGPKVKRLQQKARRTTNRERKDKENKEMKHTKRKDGSILQALRNRLDLINSSTSDNQNQGTIFNSTMNKSENDARPSLVAIDVSIIEHVETSSHPENMESLDAIVMTDLTRDSVLASIDASKNIKSEKKCIMTRSKTSRLAQGENLNIDAPKSIRDDNTNSNSTTFNQEINVTHTEDVAGLEGTNALQRNSFTAANATAPSSNTLDNDPKCSRSNVTTMEFTKRVSSACNLPSAAESREGERNDNEESATKAGDCESATGSNPLTLRSGKWRRLLSLYRRSRRTAFLLEQTDVVSINSLKISLPNESNRQTLRHSVSFNFADNFDETSDRRAARRRRTSVVTPNVNVERLNEFEFGSTVAARDTILRRCGQSEPLEFAHIYSESALRHCRKIGEGVYGEVFMNKTDAGRAIVLKIIPIEGRLEVNGEQQKKFDEVLSEIVIAQQLSSLRNDKEYMTSSFAEVIRVRCVQGSYPNHLIDLWELYRDNHQTENDHPEIFGDDQLYIVFELANGGQDLEAFQFANALQSKSAFQQMALALAIAEKKLQFEHRDLHWGNILLSPTDEKFVTFKLNGNILAIPSEGIKVTIIDYTLSRMLYEGIVLYNDLANDDELFSAHGDYQFDIYRLMKNNLENDWQRFEPFNNILWLHYIIDKLINGARYKSKSRKHRAAIEELMVIRDEITNYKSAIDSVTNI